MNKKYYLGTGWKMNHTIKDSEIYVSEFSKLAKNDKREVFILPPFTALSRVSELSKNVNYEIGSQNIHWKDKGAYTGEISPIMLKELGIKYVEIGHSERRLLFGETDETVNLKIKICLKYDLYPIICIGEPIEIKKSKVSLEYLTIQAAKALIDIPKNNYSKLIFAYEPIWAIGEKGEPASADFAEEIIHGVKNNLSLKFGDSVNDIPFIYGGSVNYENALAFINMSSIDGLFIGREAWDAKSFLRIIELVDNKLN